MPVGPYRVATAATRSRPRPWKSGLLAGGAVLAVLIAPPAGAQNNNAAANGTTGNTHEKNITRQVQAETSINLPSLHPLVERVLPAVVNISAQLSEAATMSDRSADEGSPGEVNPGGNDGDESGSPFDQFLRRFFDNHGLPQAGQAGHKVVALGSGFIIDPSGYVVTNNHVVGDSHKVTVILQDNSRYPAKVIGRDSKTDLALLKISVDHKLPFVTWGDSNDTQVGDWIVAVGNPFGLGGTVTAGIVSALGRNIEEGPYDDFIQLDAPINRGNSGGPTFNLKGQVIGINTAIYSPSGGSVGIGFAIPSDTAKNVVQQLRETGHVVRGWLGVAVQGVTPAIAKSLGMQKAEGALIASVNPGTPAAHAGLQQGDVIISADGHQIKTVHDLPRVVAATPPGRTLKMEVLRNGKQQQIAAKVAQMPENPEVAGAGGSTGKEATSLGLQLSSVTPELRKKYHIPTGVTGVVVTDIAPDSPAAVLGIQSGDVIISIDRQPARTPEQAATELKQASTKGNILLLLNRKGTSQFVGLSVSPGGVGNGSPG